MQMEIKCKTSGGGVINVRVSHLLQSGVFKNMWRNRNDKHVQQTSTITSTTRRGGGKYQQKNK
ncbi:unnamed protein product [Meloidogyne enterolobii]|uniref:Uncharacterized protein n=1 Tax=Meloidogyne enterolobii TaxID=390850 RepID=A0ACB0XTP5_MELEN